MAILPPELDPDTRIISSYKMTDRELWPKASSEFLFIAEAIHLVGKALFGNDWTGNELLSRNWDRSPIEERQWDKVPKGRGGGSRGTGTYSSRQPVRYAPIEHVQDWYAQQRQVVWMENKAAKTRLRSSVEWLAQRCRDAELQSYARFRSGGVLIAMKASEWNVDDATFTFARIGGHSRYFHELKHKGPYEVYIFFQRSKLLDVLAQAPETPSVIAQADLSRLSPYLRLAAQLAEKNGYYSRDASDTLDVRKAEVRALWPLFLPEIAPVESTVDRIAKLIGFPDYEAIKRGQRGGRSKKTGETP